MLRTIGGSAVPRLFLLLGAALMLGSCITMATESEFNEDGGGTHTMTVTIDRESAEQLGDLGEGGEDPLEEFGTIDPADVPEGYTAEAIDTDEEVGVRLSRTVDDSTNLGDILNELFNASSTEDDGEDVFPFEGTFEKDGDTYRIDLAVNGDILTDTASEDLDEGAEGEDPFSDIPLDSLFEFTYTIRMPGEIDEDETNGRVNADGSVTWDLPLQGTETFTAVSRDDSGGTDILLIIVVVGIIVLGLIALAAVGFFIFMSRRGSGPAAAGAPAGYPPPQGGVPGSDQPTQPMTPPPSQPPPPDQQNRPPSF
jgi:hypothetical protein